MTMKIKVNHIDTRDMDGYKIPMVMLDDGKTMLNLGGRSLPF